MGTLLAAAVVVASGRVHRPGWVEIDGDTVVAVGGGEPPRPPDRVVSGSWLVPGFVDIHVHGGGGATFSTVDPAEIEQVIRTHRAGGTTRLLASLVTTDAPTLRAQVRALVAPARAGEIEGIHLEGPWLAPERRGAHDETMLRHPAPHEIEELLADADGHLRMVTLAPELPGAIAAIGQLVDAGVTVAVGHTDATFDVTRAAIEAGATVATHLFNAMRPLKHREPGPVLALVDDSRVTVELILDGTHLHPAVFDQVRRSVGAERIALITDAMAATGMPDGDYTLGGLEVSVTDRRPTLTGTSTIAGSTATMAEVFRAALQVPLGSPDDTVLAAVQSTAITPARAIGRSPRDLAPGTPADLVVLSPRGDVELTMIGGRAVAG